MRRPPHKNFIVDITPLGVVVHFFAAECYCVHEGYCGGEGGEADGAGESGGFAGAGV